MNQANSIDQMFLDKVREAIENNLADENFGVDELALETGISRSQLHRRLNSLTGKSASQTIKEFRLNKALEMLQNHVGTASEISFKVGFKNPSHFNASFKKYFGYPPGKVKHIGFSKKGDKPVTSKGWKIASYTSFVVIVGLIVLVVIPHSRNKEILEKSIAVLPFRNDSPDQERMYFINGTFEAILDNLCKIEDLRVVSRNSVEQYRNNPKSTPQVAEEMDVGYVLEGSGHRDGDRVRLFVQLFDGTKDEHLWSKSFDSDIDEIFSMMSEIAQSVAEEIEAIVTPEEKQLIEKIPTLDLTAYEFYQQGNEEHEKVMNTFGDKEALARAEKLFHKALDCDSTFALAYTGLAKLIWWKSMPAYFSENYLDSQLILADLAISYDNQVDEAYWVKGFCYNALGKKEQALEEYDKAIALNPNNWLAYKSKGNLYVRIDNFEALKNFHKAASLNRGKEYPDLLRFIASCYYSAGFREKWLHYRKELLRLDGDSAGYFWSLSWDATRQNEFAKGVAYGKKALAIDSSGVGILAWNYNGLGQYKQSLECLQKSVERSDTSGHILLGEMHRLGYAYWQNGNKEKANYYFDKQIEYCNKANEQGRNYSTNFRSYYDLAATYAFRGEKKKAFENLKMYNQKKKIDYVELNLVKYDPLFDSIRDEPEFQQILADIESKYQAEHERVRQWLEENDML